MDATALRDRLIGTWSLISYELTTDTGALVQPIGPNPVGFIHYAPDGFMAAHLMRADRALTGVSSDEVEAAVASRILAENFSYCGTFRTEHGLVIHTINVAVMPDWVGSEQRREVTFEGDRLVLAANGVRNVNGTGRAVLTWEPNEPR
jgi:hypothetical protein